MTVEKIIYYLKNTNPNDCRIDFWERVMEYLNKGEYSFIFYVLLAGHSADDDFKEQIIAVSNSIAHREIAELNC